MKHAHQRMQEVFGSPQGLLVWSLHHFARTMQPFDITFLQREPILDVTLSKHWAREFCTAFLSNSDRNIARLLERVAFSDGTVVDLREVWTINYMPAELDTAGVDLARGEEVIGAGGETVRQIVRATYRCRSRAEEDFFLARWIAS
jgi:hypothetical protein